MGKVVIREVVMTISVVIPTYNGEKYIADSIESVLNQTRPADEIIISDDNSSDATLDICRRYLPKIKIFKNPSGPSGFVNGWNRAIGHATGEYVSVLHQDELLAPTFLKEIQKAMEANPDVGHFFALCNVIDGTGKVIRVAPNLSGKVAREKVHRYSGREYVEAYLFTPGNLHRCPGVVTARYLLAKCAYREDAGHIADDDFFYRIGNFTDVVGILLPLAGYREHQGSETGHLSELNLCLRLLDDYYFQLENISLNPLIGVKEIKEFKARELRFCHRVMIYGILERQWRKAFHGLYRWLSMKKGHGNLRYEIARWFR